MYTLTLLLTIYAECIFTATSVVIIMLKRSTIISHAVNFHNAVTTFQPSCFERVDYLFYHKILGAKNFSDSLRKTIMDRV